MSQRGFPVGEIITYSGTMKHRQKRNSVIDITSFRINVRELVI